MDDLLTYLSTDTGSSIVGALLVTLIVQGVKKWSPLTPGSDAVVKQLVAGLSSLVMALATAGLAGTLTWGVVVVKLLQVWGGATLLHAVALRSEASSSPGKVDGAGSGGRGLRA